MPNFDYPVVPEICTPYYVSVEPQSLNIVDSFEGDIGSRSTSLIHLMMPTDFDIRNVRAVRDEDGTVRLSNILPIDVFNNQLQVKIKENKVREMRAMRDALLDKTDKYTIPDWPHPTQEVRQAWFDYRQALRDLPANTEDPENPVWPTAPTS